MSVRKFNLYRFGKHVGSIRAGSPQRVFELARKKPELSHIPASELDIQNPNIQRQGNGIRKAA